MKDTSEVKITVRERKSITNPLSRAMEEAGREASAAAIKQAKDAGISICYLKNGMVVWEPPLDED